MPAALDSSSYQVIWLIRRLFRALSQKSNENLEAFGISSADRAVMEFLFPDHALSVPEIAEKYQVSRQHIQVTVNALLDKVYLQTKTNPRHKRSSLIALTTKGRQLFKAIIKKDETVVDELFSTLKKKDIQVTRDTLHTLLSELQGGNENEHI